MHSNRNNSDLLSHPAHADDSGKSTSSIITEEKDTKRPLGLGFGLGISFLIFYFQQLRILINPIAIKQMTAKQEALQQWIIRNNRVKERDDINNLMGKDDIVNVLGNDELLGDIINDVLDDRSVIQLAKRLPLILHDLETNVRALFSKSENLIRFRNAYLTSWENYTNLHEIMKITLKKSANLPERPNHPLGTFNMFLEKLQAKNSQHFPVKIPNPNDKNFITDMQNMLSIENILRINPTFMATLIPIIIYHMDRDDRIKVATEIAKRLPPHYFQIAVEANYAVFNQIENHDELLNASIDTTGRAIVFRPLKEAKTSLYHYRGKKWKLNHLHIHFEMEGEEGEYRLYQSEESLAQEAKNAKAGIKPTANKEMAGEVHIVLERTSSKKGNQRLMALGFIMKVNSSSTYSGNAEIAKLLEQYEHNQEISFNIQKAFMPNLAAALAHNLVIDSNWASTESATHAFQAGLRFLVVLPDGEFKTSVEVSENQYKKLREIFNSKNEAKFPREDIDPEIRMTNLAANQALHPYGRSPGL